MEVHPVGDLMSPKGQTPSNLRDGDIGKNASSGRTNICYRTTNTIDRVVLLNFSSLRNNNIISCQFSSDPDWK